MANAAVFVTTSLPEEARNLLSAFQIRESNAQDDFLARCEGLICWPSKAQGEIFRKMPGLRMVQTISAGVDMIDYQSLPAGVQVFSNAGAFTDNVSEHLWGILLGVAKGVHLRNQKTVPRRLRGKTLLVLGCGAIGSEVARMSKSINMKTVGVSRSFKSPEQFDEMHPLSDLSGSIAGADAVVVTLPLTKKTQGVIDYACLSMAKEEVIIVNGGRGETIQEADLMRWLKERPESRFATDVYWFEAGKERFSTAAWELPNFAGTLHVSGLPLGEDLSGAKVAAARNVKRFFETGDALNRVDVSEYL